MLVLEFELDETLVLSDAATGAVLAQIKVCDFRWKKVRLGTTADKSIHIDRKAIFERRQQQRAAQAAAGGAR